MLLLSETKIVIQILSMLCEPRLKTEKPFIALHLNGEQSVLVLLETVAFASPLFSLARN